MERSSETCRREVGTSGGKEKGDCGSCGIFGVRLIHVRHHYFNFILGLIATPIAEGFHLYPLIFLSPLADSNCPIPEIGVLCYYVKNYSIDVEHKEHSYIKGHERELQQKDKEKLIIISIIMTWPFLLLLVSASFSYCLYSVLEGRNKSS